MDYISFIRSRVGHEKVILNFAGGILANEEGKILLQLRGDKKTWAIPGGAMELGESSLDTCRREFFEETGMSFGWNLFIIIFLLSTFCCAAASSNFLLSSAALFCSSSFLSSSRLALNKSTISPTPFAISFTISVSLA